MQKAPNAPNPPIVVTDADLERISAIAGFQTSARDEELLERLFDELDRANVVAAPSVPAGVVTMNSRFVYRDVESNESREVTLVYPKDADPAQGRISIVAPIGAAMLGLRVGQRISWELPDGRSRTLEVVAIKYQPEASGDFHL